MPIRIVVTALAALLSLPAGAQLVDRFRTDDTGAGEVALALARKALEAYCLRREHIAVPAELPDLLRERSGVFVSAMVAGAPRCCMGTLYPRGPNLAADILDFAAMAAAHDFRFPPLRPSELPRLRVIVSIVGRPEPVADPTGLDPVQEGLAVRSRVRTGVVLPGETDELARMVAWGRIRAAAEDNEKVEYFRLEAVRFLEPEPDPR